ncbi:MAG: bifunctional acetate--CoA ligase family protein/GNAT family N-acetyltransferase [Anaerolineae bacterium]|nr:bifunctional acetate--CoA ligase family protein/GNAT family N-acetyltransferase [Anaerolineae bacterium]MCA9892882.1 bifunctional acetate--CoA ligase family protein/GNAT family N-acetyltransferase [Anaerolineae bacterium]
MSAEKTTRRAPSLDKIFKPNNVAVIGATEKEGSVGRTIIKNLITNPFGGTIFPVNPKRPNVLGIQAYPSILDIPVSIDLAIIVTPAPTVPAVVEQCVEKGVEGCIIISAGFKEIGEEGAELERRILEIADGKMRIIGPNCLGVMLPFFGMNATFAGGMARPGNVAFVSQSGAICTAVLDWSFEENVGFSAFISIGSMLDVSWGDLIYYLGEDPQTESIVIYMESVGEARAFLSAAREVALKKPIIIIKAGRTDEAAAAAASHTGSLTGSDEVLDAAFRRSGILRVNSISDVFHTAEVLAKQPLPKGNRLTIVTNAGGPGVLATDALINGGGQLTKISSETMAELNEFLPGAWSHNNPIDILGDATPERYAQTLETAARDPNSDGLLVILTPQDMTDPTQTAEALRPYSQIEGKPVLASWMGGASIHAGERILNRANIPTFAYPDTAMRLFNNMWRYSYNLRALYETPIPLAQDDDDIDRELVKQLIENVRSEGRTILTESESKQLLAAYQVPTTPMKITEDVEEAVAFADEMGYPVVLKLNSETITHKMDVGGVQLNLRNGTEVRNAFDRIREGVTRARGAEHFNGVSIQPMIDFGDGYELIIGSSVDPQFGPVLLFGTGGSLVEVFKDRSLGLPPLTTTLARRMVEQTKIFKALLGVRGRPPVDMDALLDLLVRFSQLVAEQPWISEIDINPLLASPTHVLALDARVVLHPPQTKEEDLPVPAIRPYPVQYISNWESEEGTDFHIRPVRPEDEPKMVHFHETLSERTVQLRYFTPLNLRQRVSHERLSRIVFIDYDREMVLVAETPNTKTGEPEIAGVARLSRSYDKFSARFGIIISDKYQGLGLGRELLVRLIEIGRAEHVAVISGSVLKENQSMLNLANQLGFEVTSEDDTVIEVTMDLANTD